ncbi:Epn3, partial [Symbiodinium sp. CCMP2456]
EDCAMVISFIWKILQEKDEQWRRIAKTLALLEVILTCGSENAFQEIRRDQWRIQQWEDFRFLEEGTDVGAGIRSKASEVLQMLADEEVTSFRAWLEQRPPLLRFGAWEQKAWDFPLSRPEKQDLVILNLTSELDKAHRSLEDQELQEDYSPRDASSTSTLDTSVQ